MLKVQTFKIEDDKGQNELLSKYRLHEGSSVLVSNGYVCISYDDGEPVGNLQKKLLFTEMKNKKLLEREMAEFEKKIIEQQGLKFNQEMADIQEKKVATKDKDEIKEVEDRIKVMENKIRDNTFQLKRANDQIGFIDDQIEAFNQMIEKNG